MQHHNDTINKQTCEDFFRKICTSHFIVRVRKGLLRVLLWEGVGDRTELQYIDPHSYGRQRCVFLVLQGCSTEGPGAQLSAEYWLFIPHLITNWSGPQTPSGVPRAPSAWCGFPYHISSLTPSDLHLSHFLSWPSYILVQCPLNRPLNLWNGMFDCHPAEITVMQFRGHSLPVHQSMSVSWDFYLVPFHQPNPPTRSLSITSHSGASLWNGTFARVEGQNTTKEVCMFVK